MPPKKPAKGKASIKSDFLAAAGQPDSGLDAHSEPHHLSDELLARAYGLASPPPESPEYSLLLRTCPPKWNEDSKSKSKSPEVITLDSTDDDEELQQPKLKNLSRGSKAAKGKGAEDHACSLEHCKDNPRCLNWLGQDKWETSRDAFKNFAKAAGVGADPSNARDGLTPVGLRNLGSTCYANSFLQVWFRDVPFRAGVYACLPPDNGNVEASPLFQLQVLFAFLQNSQQAVYDPEPLVDSLKLDTTEQQDAQEFSKLFMSMLDHEFKKQGQKLSAEGGNPDVAKLVKTQFEGSITYGTRCDTCKNTSERQSTFTELEVNLKPNCRLEERIAASLREEKMTGDNKYYCEACSKHRDATRSTHLQTLPPVLHFSILRFVFDMESLSRRKSSGNISYPLKLDMGQFLPENARGKRPEVWYDLKGVLMHKGKSAHHGHYVAQVHDDTQKKWFLFDDEVVTPIDDLNGPDLYDEDGERRVAASKAVKPKPGKGFTRDADGSVLPKSTDAYMLIYTKRPEASEPALAIPEPPPLAVVKVEDLDKQHSEVVAAHKAKKAAVKADFEKARELKRSVYRNWDVVAEDEDSFFVDKAELRRWVEEGITDTKSKAKPKAPSPSTSAKGKQKEEQAKEKEKEEPIAPSSTAIDSAALITNDVLGITSSQAIYKTPRKDKGKGKAVTTVSDDGDVEMKSVANGASDSTEPAPSTSPTLVADSEKATSGDEAMQVDNETEQKQSKVLSNVEVLCKHNMLDPLKATQVKRVSQLGVMSLRDLGVTMEPELLICKDFCRECVWSIAADSFYHRDHLALVKNVDDQAKPQDGDDSVIYVSKAWYNDWKKTNPHMHISGTTNDPAPDSGPFEHDVVCEHGALRPSGKAKTWVTISESAATLLTSLFPTWTPVVSGSVELCKECEKTQESADEKTQEMSAMCKKEKPIFKSFDGQLQTRLISGAFLLVGDVNCIIPRSFLHAWIKWSRAPTKQERPGTLNNEQFICEHGRTLIDLERENEHPERIAFATDKEWAGLVKFYDAGPQIKIWEDTKARKYFTSPAICDECLDKQRKDFSNPAEIAIRMLTTEDFDDKGDRKIRSSSPEEAAVGSSRRMSGGLHSAPKTYGAAGMRASARIQNKPMMQSKKMLRYIALDKGDTVKDLSVKISENFSIPTICQRLFFQHQELDSAQTVEELGLFSGATVELFEVQQDDVDLSKLDDTIDDATLKKGKGKRAREEGFGGTALFGWESQEKVEAAEGGGMEVDGAEATVEKAQEDDEEDEFVLSVASPKRPRRGAKNGGAATAEASTSGKQGGTASSTSMGKRAKKASLVMVDTQEEGASGLACAACTFVNDLGAETCSMCEGALGVPADALS